MNDLNKTSSKMRPIKVKDLIGYIKNIYNVDLSLLRQKGSHRIYKSNLNGQNTVIPSEGNEELNKYLLSKIFRQIGLNISLKQFFDDIDQKIHKKSQQEVHQLYYDLMEKGSQGVEIIGSGQNEMISIPGASKTINARDLLQQVVNKIKPILMSNNVRTIDTSPISNPNAQGQAISNQAGTVFVDVKKIFENVKRSLPANVQLDGVTVDPDIANSMIDRVARYIESKLTETAAHESRHNKDYIGAWESGQDFSTVQESPAEQYGQKVRKQFYPETFTASIRKQWIKIAQSRDWNISNWKEMVNKAFSLLDTKFGKFINTSEANDGIIYKLTQSIYSEFGIYAQIKVNIQGSILNANIRIIKKKPYLSAKEESFSLNINELNKMPYLAVKKVYKLLEVILKDSDIDNDNDDDNNDDNNDDDDNNDNSPLSPFSRSLSYAKTNGVNWFNKISQSHISNPTERGIDISKDGKYILYYSSNNVKDLHKLKTLPSGTILTAYPNASKRVGNNLLDDDAKTLKIKVDPSFLILGSRIITNQEIPLDIIG